MVWSQPLILLTPESYDVRVSDRVHQLKPNGELEDTARCGREL